MVSPLEQAVLALMIFAIMLGMGASLTPRDFYLALRRPYGLMIGLVSGSPGLTTAPYSLPVRIAAAVSTRKPASCCSAPWHA